MISRNEFQKRMHAVAVEAFNLSHTEGSEAAANYLEAEQIKLVGLLLEDGQITDAQAVEMVEAIGQMKAAFLRNAL